MATPSLEQAKRIVLECVELFTRNIDRYHRAEYKEAQLRVEFLDPFFEALGLDVANRQGWAEQYKEVVNEIDSKGYGSELIHYLRKIGDHTRARKVAGLLIVQAKMIVSAIIDTDVKAEAETVRAIRAQMQQDRNAKSKR